MWSWEANTFMKKLGTASVLPTSKSGFRCHPKSPVDSLSMKRRNRNLFFNSRRVTLVEMFFLPSMPSAFLQSGLCAKPGHVLYLGMQCMSECRRRNADSQLYRTGLQNFLCLRSFLEPRSKGTSAISGMIFRFAS